MSNKAKSDAYGNTFGNALNQWESGNFTLKR